MPYLRRASIAFALLSSQACDCGDHAPLDGPSTRDFVEVSASSVAAVGFVPFDVDRRDLVGPDSHDTNYGKPPEIVVAPGDGYLDALVRSTDETTGPHAFLVRIRDTAGALALEQAFEVPSLGLVLGFVRGADGSFYYATGSYDDEITTSYPGKNQHRSNVVRVFHAAPDGEILWDVDLDTAREEAFPDSEPLVNPATASSARLGLAGDMLALVAGNNTAPDGNGTRHQKAVTTILDPATGAVIRPSSIWMSHSFDERYVADGSDLYEVHLGDAYDRKIAITRLRAQRAGDSFGAYFPKGGTGNNNTFTRLGQFARVTGGAEDGAFLVLFATERTTESTDRIEGARDLAIVRLVPGFADTDPDDGVAVDDTIGVTWAVDSGGATQTNRAVFLTNFHAAGATEHVERPKLLALPGGEFLVLYERWTTGGMQTFGGTYAMRIDASGAILDGPDRVSDHHLPRGDDAFLYGGDAAWLSGDETTRTLQLHRVSPALAVTETTVP